MAVFRVHGVVDDPEEVYSWIRENIPDNQVVRQIAYKTRPGWWLKIVFKRQSDAEHFHRVWWPDAASHAIPPWK